MPEQVKYFAFSQRQLDFQKDLYRKIGKLYINKYVIYNGNKYQYTEILGNASDSKYTDAKIVASGTLSTMKYTE